MKLHRHVALIEVNDPAIIDALAADDSWDRWVLHRISPSAVAVRMNEVENVTSALRKLGYLPRMIER